MYTTMEVPTSLFNLLVESVQYARIIHNQPQDVQDKWNTVIDQTLTAATEVLAQHKTKVALDSIGSDTPPQAGSFNSYL